MESTKQPRLPTHDVFMVEGEGETAFWTRIGAAWAHKDDGFGVSLSCLPLNDGRIVIRKRKPKDQNHKQEAGR